MTCSIIRLRLFLFFPLLLSARLLLKQVLQLLGHTKAPIRVCSALRTALLLLLHVSLHRALLTKVVSTLCNDRHLVVTLADHTFEWNLQQHLLLVVQVRVSRVFRFTLLACLLPLLVQLPALLVVFSCVQEFTAVAETAESCLLVIFAHVGREVGHGDGAHVGGRFHGSDSLAAALVGILLDEGAVGGGALVSAIGFPLPWSSSRSAIGALERGVGEPGGRLCGVVVCCDGGVAVCAVLCRFAEVARGVLMSCRAGLDALALAAFDASARFVVGGV